MDDRALYSFFESMAQKILKEIEIMYALRGEANIVAYEDHMIVNTLGILKWDIFIRMELLIPLTAYMRNNKLPPEEVRRLGIEICSALDACASYSIIHRDIKDANIFLNNRGIYKLGDFGIAKEMNVDSVSIGMRGTPAYVAPEVYDGRKYDSTVDIYSLGILLYKLLNRGVIHSCRRHPHHLRRRIPKKHLQNVWQANPYPRLLMVMMRSGQQCLWPAIMIKRPLRHCQGDAGGAQVHGSVTLNALIGRERNEFAYNGIRMLARWQREDK